MTKVFKKKKILKILNSLTNISESTFIQIGIKSSYGDFKESLGQCIFYSENIEEINSFKKNNKNQIKNLISCLILSSLMKGEDDLFEIKDSIADLLGGFCNIIILNEKLIAIPNPGYNHRQALNMKYIHLAFALFILISFMVGLYMFG